MIYSVGLEIWVQADSESDAELIVGEHFGMNLPREIKDFSVLGSMEDSSREDLEED